MRWPRQQSSVGAALATLLWLIRLIGEPAAAPEPASAMQVQRQRRFFLGTATLVAATSVATGIVGRNLIERAKVSVAKREDVVLPAVQDSAAVTPPTPAASAAESVAPPVPQALTPPARPTVEAIPTPPRGGTSHARTDADADADGRTHASDRGASRGDGGTHGSPDGCGDSVADARTDARDRGQRCRDGADGHARAHTRADT